jgi:aminoglycoside phosphotransferase (APT) family kinase protein
MMGGFLGEKVGEGTTADIHAWAPGQVVKLFKAGVPTRLGKHEARMTRAAFTGGAPAPEVYGEVNVDGRFGFVMRRFDGPTLRDLLLTQAVTPEQAGAILATLYMSVHRTRPPPNVVSLRDWIEAVSRQSVHVLPLEIVAGVLGLIDRLPAPEGLCHTDLHPGNVIMTTSGPKIIDWTCAVRAHTVFDLGRAHISLTELVPEDADPELARAIDLAVQSEYARLAGTALAEFTATMEPHLSIVRAFVLLQRRPATSAQRERLIQRVAGALLSEANFQWRTPDHC